MGTYTGTDIAETITPTVVSPTVTRQPAGSFPSSDPDTIDGGGGGDVISAGGGDDVINDRPRYLDGVALTPNDGNTVRGGTGSDNITIEVGDTAGANPASNTAYGDDGDDDIVFGFRTDFEAGTVTGQPPNGTILAYGGAGDDHVEVYSISLPPNDLSVTLYGGPGADALWATRWWTVEDEGSTFLGTVGGAADRLVGGVGDDGYFVWEQNDVIVERLGEGNDTVSAFNTDYTLPANAEGLEMWPSFQPGSFYRGTGNDLDNRITVEENWYWRVNYTLDGLGGNDVIYGGEAPDTINGGTGNDTLYGKAAGIERDTPDADTIRGGAGDDLIYGGGGNEDTWDGDDKLYGDAGNDRIFGHNGNDLMYGGTGNDEMGGQAGNDVMYGNAGADTLGGGSGNDRLYGGPDDDVLTGRDGLDRLTGDDGNDVFRYEWVTDSNPGVALRDVITDFAGIGSSLTIDRIDLSAIDADTGLSGNQAFAFRGTAAFDGAGQIRVIPASPTSTNTLIQANTGGTLEPEMEIAVTDGATLPEDWSASDFIL